MSRFYCGQLFLLVLLGSAVLTSGQTSTAPSNCDEPERAKLYTDYYNLKRGSAAEQKQARELATTYVQKYSGCKDQYTAAVDKFVDLYDKALADLVLRDKMTAAYNQQKFSEAVRAAKEMLAKNPDDAYAAIAGAWAAYRGVVAKDTSLTPDVLELGQKALDLLKIGKTADDYFFKSKPEAQAWMEYALGAAGLKDNAAAAAKHLIAAGQSNAPPAREATTYYFLARAYESEYVRLSEKYKTLKEENDESKALRAVTDHLLELIIDAYARAVKLADNSPGSESSKAGWLKQLTELYKSTHDDKTEGLDVLIAGVMNTPLRMQ
jgi:hypothetical protein